MHRSMVTRRVADRRSRRRQRSFEALEPRMLLALFAPSKDNTLFEHPAGATSMGAGQFLYAGFTRQPSNPLRRAVMAFDLTSIPAGSTITSVSLEMEVTRNPFSSLVDHNFSLHRLTTDWGEGSSTTPAAGGLGVPATPGDATWVHSSFNTQNWSTPGGDFVQSASASSLVGNEGAIASWSSGGLIADVQAWVNAPQTNFGWILRGNESATGTARRFYSREGANPPSLDVTFVQATVPEVTLAVDNTRISEGGGAATFTAVLSAAAAAPVTVELAFSGTATPATDYTAASSQIVIPAGAILGSTTVTAIQDTEDENDETIIVDIASITGGTESGVQQRSTTITDDDDPPVPNVSLSVDKAAIPEAAGTATFSATLSEPTTVPVTIELGFAGTATAEDYTASTASIVIDPGATSGSMVVTAVDDELDEADETIIVEITSVSGGIAAGVAQTTTITDDDDPPRLVVTSLTPTSGGFVVDFSGDLNTGLLNLYDTPNAALGAADVVLEGTLSGPVAGSLVIDASASRVTFIKSGGPLTPDTYSVSLRGGPGGFEDLDGRLLDGDGDGVAGDDYFAEFVVAAPPPAAITVGIPDFIRGPGQPVHLPADSPVGVPLSVSDGTGVRALDARIRYDPALLEISGAVLGPGAPAGATVVLNNSTPGLAILVYFSANPLPAGAQDVIRLQATVPADDAPNLFGAQQILDVHAVTLSDGNDNEFPVVVDDALHVANFFGDPSANGRINASDAAQVAQFAALIGSGFTAFPTTDPVLIGDISGNGRLNALDASLVARFAALISVPQIPPLPGGVQVAGVGSLAAAIAEGGLFMPAANTPPAMNPAAAFQPPIADQTTFQPVALFSGLDSGQAEFARSTDAALKDGAVLSLEQAIDALFT